MSEGQELSHLAGPGRRAEELASLADIHIKVRFRARVPYLGLVGSQLRLSGTELSSMGIVQG